MNLVGKYISRKNILRSSIKDECKSCIEKYGENLKFIDIGTKIYCVYNIENVQYQIYNIEDCSRELEQEDIDYFLISKFAKNGINILDPTDY